MKSSIKHTSYFIAVYVCIFFSLSVFGYEKISIKYPLGSEFTEKKVTEKLFMEHKVPIIQVKIGQAKYRFLIDTGSEIHKVNHAVLVDELKYISNYQVNINLVKKDIPVYKIQKLNIGSMSINDLFVTSFEETMHPKLQQILQYKNIVGILGYSVFKDMLMEFDFKDNLFSLSKNTLASHAATLLKIPNESLPIVEARFFHDKREVKLPMVIDTGFMAHIRMPTHVVGLPFKMKPINKKCEGIHVHGIQACKIYEVNAKLNIANLYWSSPIVQVGQKDADYSLNTPYGLIGMGILKNYKLSIDTLNYLLMFSTG